MRMNMMFDIEPEIDRITHAYRASNNLGEIMPHKATEIDPECATAEEEKKEDAIHSRYLTEKYYSDERMMVIESHAKEFEEVFHENYKDNKKLGQAMKNLMEKLLWELI